MSILGKLKAALSDAGTAGRTLGPTYKVIREGIEALRQEGWVSIVHEDDQNRDSTVLILGSSRMEGGEELRLLDFLKKMNGYAPIGILASEGERSTVNPDLMRFFPDKETNEKLVRELLLKPSQEREQLGANAFVGFYIATESSAPFLPVFDLGALTPEIAMAAARFEPEAQRIFLDAVKECSRRSAARVCQEMKSRRCSFGVLQGQSLILQPPSGYCAKTAFAAHPVNTIGCMLL